MVPAKAPFYGKPAETSLQTNKQFDVFDRRCEILSARCSPMMLKLTISSSLLAIPALVTTSWALSGCLVKRTVTDSFGQVIYSEPQIHMPFESAAEKREEVLEKERELGHY